MILTIFSFIYAGLETLGILVNWYESPRITKLWTRHSIILKLNYLTGYYANAFDAGVKCSNTRRVSEFLRTWRVSYTSIPFSLACRLKFLNSFLDLYVQHLNISFWKYFFHPLQFSLLVIFGSIGFYSIFVGAVPWAIQMNKGWLNSFPLSGFLSS